MKKNSRRNKGLLLNVEKVRDLRSVPDKALENAAGGTGGDGDSYCSFTSNRSKFGE